jgi:hypothetical protein
MSGDRVRSSPNASAARQVFENASTRQRLRWYAGVNRIFPKAQMANAEAGCCQEAVDGKEEMTGARRA